MNVKLGILAELVLVATVIVLALYFGVTSSGITTTQYQLTLDLLLVVTSATSVIMLYLFYKTFGVQRSYRVAVIGFQRSGKTTLITSLFGESFARRLGISGYLVPRGTLTIEKVNKYLEQLRKGKAIGPTHDQDMFAFRADAVYGRLPLRTTVRLEFGDFPGHLSEEYVDQMAVLHNNDFFRWVADSDAIIFVVDLGCYLSNFRAKKDYVAEVTSIFRAEWQQYLDTNRYRLKEVRRHPVLIVFNKSDLICRLSDKISLASIEMMTHDEVKSIEDTARDLAFGEKIPPIIELDKMRLNSEEEVIERDFAELIEYFKFEASRTDVVFTSSFGTLNGRRLGMGMLFLQVLKGAI